MYNAIKSDYPQPGQIDKTESELVSIINRFNNGNVRCLEFCIAIQEKLHGILNLRTQEDVNSNKEGSQIPNSFVEAANDNLHSLQQNNYRLESILNHINKIV